MSAWRVWQASPADADTLAALESRAFGGRSWGEKNVKASFGAAQVSVLLGGPASGPEGSGAAGFALWRDLGEEAELLTIGVVPESRTKGLGATLLGAVLAAAREAGAEKIYLEVGKENPAALALYRRAGFEYLGARKRYYRDGGDAAVMALGL